MIIKRNRKISYCLEDTRKNLMKSVVTCLWLGIFQYSFDATTVALTYFYIIPY